ncbi:inhibitor of KinA [Algoriphagus sp. 4150]|uniref:5-oxoprolinase subunit PxpB n=1 Tax=Algoriphagus sp. 4150 TaxID=2817756 RepID=UPI00285EB2AD|nr:5-oxoprolinase subunit PxpB [Algoriphagus sp. 4150]MDR7130762.1 inhibitor of KinA [Algoriphagus sp. 4150]
MIPKLSQISPLLYEFEWNSEVSDKLLQQQLSFKAKLLHDFNPKIVDMRIGFKTLAIILSHPIEFTEIDNWLKSFDSEDSSYPLPEKIREIPVCYSLETGRDLEVLAQSKKITSAELISIHSAPLYRLHFYGFLPGFMYLNGLRKELHTDRKSVPDRIVPSGSVAIGGTQTGIYPSSSPGGWHLIGQTPISLFDPKQPIPVFASAGERIEFIPITVQEFDQLKRHPQKPKFK